MTQQPPFFRFVFNDPLNKRYLYIGLTAGVIYFILLRLLFPYPSFYADSYTYISAAQLHQVISYRPIQYSEFINFFHYFSGSDTALIIAQYLFSVLANLFLFFSFIYFFHLSARLQKVLFAVLVFNPLYLLAANYILSDSFFCSLTVAWFTLLVWLMYKPNAVNMLGQLLLLVLLFKLRYNALIFPVFTTVALVFSKQALWKKISIAVISFAVLLLLMNRISDKTEELTGTPTFSAFSGWQMTSDAMHVIKHQPIDTSELDADGLMINRFITEYFNSPDSESVAPTEEVTADYIWNKDSPLKKYLFYYGSKNYYNSYFETWTALGPVYNDFGTAVIKQQPLAYIRYFVWPNTKRYFSAEMEAYGAYNEGHDTIAKVAVNYFNYKENTIGTGNAALHVLLLDPWRYLFPFINFLFLIVVVLYLVTGSFRSRTKLFNHTLLLFSTFYLGNLCFVTAVAPNVFRYHLFIITLLCIFLIYIVNSFPVSVPKPAAGKK